ncbi:MAG: hypothetical protein HY736_06740 [Verrucomicrobia bacterium]|nr:hypothetical protein [Verrucomicrobiota bacterium]
MSRIVRYTLLVDRERDRIHLARLRHDELGQLHRNALARETGHALERREIYMVQDGLAGGDGEPAGGQRTRAGKLHDGIIP